MQPTQQFEEEHLEDGSDTSSRLSDEIPESPDPRKKLGETTQFFGEKTGITIDEDLVVEQADEVAERLLNYIFREHLSQLSVQIQSDFEG